MDRDALVSVTASLAAAISLLERTPKAKKAAPSDTMFAQMLVDYRKSLETGRAALIANRITANRETHMTDAQMLQNLLAVYENMVLLSSPPRLYGGWLPELKEVIAELRRRIALKETK